MRLSNPNKLKRVRPTLPKVSEEMKAWSAALGAEITGWPQVTIRAFFGFTALYRRDKIFGLLPRTRAMETPDSLAFKLESAGARTLTQLQQDRRLGSTEMQKARWFTFQITSAADLRDALKWLGRAYEAAGTSKKRS